MTAETDKDYMRVAMNIDSSINIPDESIRRVTERQIQKNLEERDREDIMRHNEDVAYFDRLYEGQKTPLRDLLQHNPDDWDNFLNGHLGAYIDFQNWLRDQYFNKKDEALVRIVDRAIEELES